MKITNPFHQNMFQVNAQFPRDQWTESISVKLIHAVRPKKAQILLVINFRQEQFLENICRNLDQNPTYNSPTNSL